MTHHTGAIPASPRKPDWRDQAACSNDDPEAFFPQPTNRIAVQEAKAVCFRCPVMTSCAQYALRTRQDVGVWGGLSEGQRTTLVKKHRAHELEDPATVRSLVYRALRDELNPVRSLRDLWDDNTRPLPGGHIAWTSTSTHVTFHGVNYTAKQLAFVVDRGHKAVGVVRRMPECPVVECVNPRHLADNEERFQRKQAEQQAAALDAANEALAS